jgi:hypothetical protein
MFRQNKPARTSEKTPERAVADLTLITATGCRPRQFALLERMMLAQDFTGSVVWIIVDDGALAQPVIFERENWSTIVMRPEPFWKGENTQARNLSAGLVACDDGRPIAIIEDDDFYAPSWLSTVAAWLQTHDLVGEKQARYYNVPRCLYRNMSNSEHASLCSTALKGSAVTLLRDLAEQAHDYIDIELWKYEGAKALHDTRLTVGIKGLPGRNGIGWGHAPGFAGSLDSRGEVLRAWVGEDFANDYERLVSSA